MSRSQALAAVSAAPLEPASHEKLGDVLVACGQAVAAHACYRTALALGGDGNDLRAKADAGREISLAGLDHNRTFRFRCLRDELLACAGRSDFSLLDIGGGDGSLSLMLPDTAYQLVEPGTNGLSAEDLPHSPDSVDVVCACHVFEHIPPDAREDFLEGLVGLARGHVLLLNPFAAAGGHHQERLRIAVDILDAGWAKEHLACGLPQLDEVTDWARRRGLACRTWPNGAVGTAFLVTWVNHYARLAGRAVEAERINRYLDSLPPDLLTAPALPAAWFVHLDLGG
ncbi:MAG: class I SAM-dependent methyltransferase [bacterium]|nr:class I SAM-dependent methyltransferase [bacterium]